MVMVMDTVDTDTREEDMDTEDTTARGRPSPRPLLLLRPTPRLMLTPTTEVTMEATAWDTTERERTSLVMDTVTMARGGVMDMDTEPEDTIMARRRLSPVTTRTGAMATGPEDTVVMAMDTVSTTDKRSDENCQSSIEFRC